MGRYTGWGVEWAKRDRTHALLTASRPMPLWAAMYFNMLGDKRGNWTSSQQVRPGAPKNIVSGKVSHAKCWKFVVFKVKSEKEMLWSVHMEAFGTLKKNISFRANFGRLNLDIHRPVKKVVFVKIHPKDKTFDWFSGSFLRPDKLERGTERVRQRISSCRCHFLTKLSAPELYWHPIRGRLESCVLRFWHQCLHQTCDAMKTEYPKGKFCFHYTDAVIDLHLFHRFTNSNIN